MKILVLRCTFDEGDASTSSERVGRLTLTPRGIERGEGQGRGASLEIEGVEENHRGTEVQRRLFGVQGCRFLLPGLVISSRRGQGGLSTPFGIMVKRLALFSSLRSEPMLSRTSVAYENARNLC